jgi:hypothetical protein
MLGEDWYQWGDWWIEDAPDPSIDAPPNEKQRLSP